MPQIRPSRIRNLALLAFLLLIGCYMVVKVAYPRDDFKEASRQSPDWKYQSRRDLSGVGSVGGAGNGPGSGPGHRPGHRPGNRPGPASPPGHPRHPHPYPYPRTPRLHRQANPDDQAQEPSVFKRPHFPSAGHRNKIADDDGGVPDSRRNNIYDNFDNLDFDNLFDYDDDYDNIFDDEDLDYYYDFERPDSCPEYGRYSSSPHYPLSSGPLRLPYQRPVPACRTFKSQAVEDVITKFNKDLSDLDLARLFENCFPNTLDTTIRWHFNGSAKNNINPQLNIPQTFVVTGDINAEWLRDSYRQLLPYIPLAPQDPSLKTLILGAINTQAQFVSQFPYCNAFHPPPESKIRVPRHNMNDEVFPTVDPNVVFECKYELDSLAAFLALSNEYYKITKDLSFVNDQYLKALDKLLQVLEEQSIPTYEDAGTGTATVPKYTFQRNTNTGTETLNLAGMGNPVNANVSLIRSAFRPSDDATIFQYFIPANAQISVELKKAAEVLTATNNPALSSKCSTYGNDIEAAIWQHGIYHHKTFGDVFAYEIDGYGGIISLDDANLPSLLSLPILGFLERSNPIYQNTRKMILSKAGNPYYLHGKWFSGIGGPHIGLHNAWPMSLLVAIRSSDDDDEIESLLEIVKKSTAGLGLMHESVNVDVPFSYTRSWFAWANSEFAQTIIDISKRKPHIIFEDSSAAPPPSQQQQQPQKPLLAGDI